MMTKTNLAFTNFKAKTISSNSRRRLPNQRSPYGVLFGKNAWRDYLERHRRMYQSRLAIWFCLPGFTWSRSTGSTWVSYGKIFSGPQTFGSRLSALAYKASRIQKWTDVHHFNLFSVMGMRDSEMLCEFIHTIIGQRKIGRTHQAGCRSKLNNLLYQSGSF